MKEKLIIALAPIYFGFEEYSKGIMQAKPDKHLAAKQTIEAVQILLDEYYKKENGDKI